MSEAGIEQEALEHSHMCAVEEVEVVEVMGGVEAVDWSNAICKRHTIQCMFVVEHELTCTTLYM